jgi:choline/glycine/proline betaine transport protein
MIRASTGFFKGLNPTVSIISKIVIITFVLFGTLWTDTASQLFDEWKKNIILGMKWYYIGTVAMFLFIAIWLMLSRYGDVRLGDDDERPEFSYFSWFAMLFSAGMGIGLVFYSIAEPIYHFQANPFITPEMSMTPEAAQVAMRLTFLHWGFHPWAIYVMVGLPLAYFAYRKKLPLTIRSALYPLIGEKIYGPIGHAADVLAVFGTVFGLATSLGLGAQQMDTGLAYLFGYESYATSALTAKAEQADYIDKNCTAMTVATEKTLCLELAQQNHPIPFPISLTLLIAIITAIATWSVVSGVGRGIKILSEVNLWLSIVLLIFFLTFGPTRYLLNSLLQNIGDYIAHVIPLSLWTDAVKNTNWQDNWTTFYWGWWIAWSPFVGIFIARISRGRTIREFILGVLLVPTLLAFVWLTLLGGTALYIEMHDQTNSIVTAVNTDLTIALYTTFEKMDVGIWGTLASCIATILIATYFITSSDSATLVVNTILSIGDENPPTFHRVFWGIGEGTVATVLLILGGLSALQTASIVGALPFSFIIWIMIYGLVKALKQEKLYLYRLEPH